MANRSAAAATLFFLVIIRAALAQPSDSCDCDIKSRYEASYDALLFLDEDDRAIAERIHLPWGTPLNNSAGGESLFHQDDFVLAFDADLRCPLWAAYRLEARDLRFALTRTECFRPDPRIADANDSPNCDDYEEPTFDRGHLVPSADMARSEISMINTYLFSNMTPQEGQFNRGIWEEFEDSVRRWSLRRGQIFVITGCIFDRDDNGARDADDQSVRMQSNNGQARVGVPSHFYKIVVFERTTGHMDSIAILLPHTPKPANITRDDYLRAHITSIDEIESMAGADFFPDLHPVIESALESFIAPALWAR